LSIKQAVVEYDEFEYLERKSLNYGHSFGHVIETLTGYKIPHGEAVLLGIYIINKLFNNSAKITGIVEKYASLSKLSGIDTDALVNNLVTDKKVINGIISLVVVNVPGETVFVQSPIDSNLVKRVYEIFAN
jgi:3-dehydroquinate synthase